MQEGMIHTKCNVEGCWEKATFKVGFETYASGYPATKANKVELCMNLIVCDKHAQEKRFLKEEFFPPGQWKRILEMFTNIGKRAPDFNRLRAVFKPLPKE